MWDESALVAYLVDHWKTLIRANEKRLKWASLMTMELWTRLDVMDFFDDLGRKIDNSIDNENVYYD